MQKKNKLPSQKVIDSAMADQNVRINLVKQNPLWFFAIYFPHYIEYPIADFQREMFDIIQDDSIKQAVIVSFRGSAKSTIMTLCYTLWAVLGIQQKKFIVIISQTQEQAKKHLINLKRELSANALLRADLGPFQEDEEWSAASIVLPKYNARIMAASTEQSIRGIKHGACRPDLIIADDIDDLNSVKTSEARQKTYEWFNGEIVPLGNRNTRIIVIGNLLHEDSLIMRLKQEIEGGSRKGVFRAYPIIDENENILWPGKYKDMEAIEDERKTMDKFSFARELMLQIIDNREAVIYKEDIHYYENVPEPSENQLCEYITGVDLAISQKETSDSTSMVTLKLIGSGKKLKIYVLPNPINGKFSFSKMLEIATMLSMRLGGLTSNLFCIEEVMLQGYVIQHFIDNNLRAEGIKINGTDKRTRLIMASDRIKKGMILFPKKGAEQLIQQILGFGIARHDDLVDALTAAVLWIINNPPEPTIMCSGSGSVRIID